MTGGMNRRCVAALGEAGAAHCAFPQRSYDYIQSPIFPMQSQLDAYQMANILGEGRAGSCFPKPDTCNATEVETMRRYQTDFFSAIASSSTFTRRGNGAFLHNCVIHCGEQTEKGFNGYMVEGKLMQKALSQWWEAPKTDLSAQHSYVENCSLNEAPPRHCNPTCGPRAAL